MKRLSYFIVTITATLVLSFFLLSCKNIVDLSAIKEYHNLNFPAQENNLTKGTNLFVDYSTCVAVAQNSPFYQAVHPTIIAAKPTFYSIKGNSIKQEQGDVFTLLKTIHEVNYADLYSAANMMADSNKESILITDGEYYRPNIAGSSINNPYLKDSFCKWLLKGHDIYIYSEPYIENNKFNKYRYYFIFTDNRIPGNLYQQISKNIKLSDYQNVKLTHLSIDHPILLSNNGTCSTVNLNLACTPKSFVGYEAQDWFVDWNTINDVIIQATNDIGTPLKYGDKVISGLKLDRISLGSFEISDIDCKVYDISDSYIAAYDAINSGGTLTKNAGTSKEVNGIFIMDKESFAKHGDIDIYFDKNNFNNAELSNEHENILKVDIKIHQVNDIFSNDKTQMDRFTFDAINMPGVKNTSVFESIKLTLTSPEISQRLYNNCLYTFYIRSEKL